ncbi:MAG: prevent-host-death protein [Spirochaetaceae bacterium]|nr:prevent-host-death protein [Spirochaetaceae bacterium]
MTRSKFTSLRDELDVEDVIAVTRRGEVELAVMRWELYQGILTTLDILGDRELMDQLRASREAVREGRFVTLDELDEEL